MTSGQYLRADKRVLMLSGATILYMAISMLYAIAQKTANTGTYIQLVIFVAAFVTSVAGFVMFRGQKRCGIIMAGMGAASFLAMMCLGSEELTYVYAFPILISAITYLNKRFAIAGTTVILIANVIRTFRDVDLGTMDIGFVMIRWTITILICVAAYSVMDITQKFNEENMTKIRRAAAEQERAAVKMVATAEKINQNFESANEMLEKLKMSIDTNSFSMNNIAESTESTAQKIQEQANMCSSIQESSDLAGKETAKVAEVSKSVSRNVEEGTKLVRDLKGQAEGVESASMETVRATERLAERVDEVLTSETLIHDPKEPERLPEKTEGVLRFDRVSFRYPGADEDVLHDITFTAKPGETTAIIGSTGSGKSTLVNLIPRFYDVTEGSITLDGIDIREIRQHDLREKLGYVPQKGVLFSGTIGSNILFGNQKGSDGEMQEAAEIAQAMEFIETKPDRFESSISQGGANVSGGQKQRLSIARAVAKHPDVFIFDDSFSALDYKTDVTLRKALKEKTENSTVLIVAQRISTILHAEQIIVLDDGEVAGIGTHRELLRDCEVYRQIAESQLSEQELAETGINSRKEELTHE